MKGRVMSVNPDRTKWGPPQIAIGYFVLGVLWILFSDKIAARMAVNAEALSQIGIYKGWGYVFVTAILLYWLIKRHTMSIREANQRYKLLAENASDVIWLLDPLQGKFKYISPSVLKLRGYTAEEAMSQPLHETFLPEDAERLSALVMERLALFQAKGSGTVSYTDEISQPHRDGPIVHTEVTTTYFFNRQNEIEIVGVTRNITQRKQAELKQRASEKKYQELLDQASDGILIADTNEQYTLVNEQACRLVGYTKDELLSMNLRDLVAPEDLEASPLRLDELRAGKTLLTERKLLHKNESRINCEISAKMLPDGSFQSIIRDITERKVTEQALIRSEKRYRSLFENMSNGYARCQILYDEADKPVDFTYLDVNNAFKKLTGLKDVLGRRVSEVIPGIHESNPELLEIYGRVASTGKPDGFETYVPELGSGIWFSVSAYSSEKGFFVAVFENITERKRGEESLKRSYKQLLSFIDHAPLSIAMFDKEMNYLATSRRWIHDYGWGDTSLIGLNYYQAHPDLPDSWKEAHQKGLAGETSRNDDDLWVQADGIKHWLRWALTPWMDEHGKIGGVIISSEDISERKRAEATAFRSELRYHRVLDAMMEGCQIIDFGWKYVYVNGVAAGQGKHKPQELVNHTMMEIYPGIEQTELFRALRRCMEDREPRRMENQFIFPDGSIGWFELSIQPAEEGIFILSTDISERKRAEEALRQSEQKFSILFEKSTFAASLSRLSDSAIVEVNESFERSFGYARQEALGKTSLELGINPDSESRTRILAALKESNSAHNVEMALQSKSGEVRIYSVNVDIVAIDGQNYILNTARDITERKQAEETIRDLARFPEENPNPILRTSMEGQIIYSNSAGKKWLSEWNSTVGGFPPDEWKNSILDIYTRGMKQSYDISIQDQTYSVLVVPIKEAGYVNIYGRDITERIQAEKKIQESEHRYRELVQNANSAIIRWRRDGSIAFFNEYAQGFFGYSPEEILGVNVSILVPETESTGGDLSQLVESVVEHPEQFVNFVNENICRDGRRVWMAWTNKPIYDEDGEITEILAVGVDITDRKHAEEALRQSQENFSRAFNSNPAALAITRIDDGTFLIVNEAYTKIMGYEAGEILGHTVADLNIYVNPEERKQLILQLQKQGRVRNYELLVRSSSGSVKTLIVSMEPILYDNDQCILSTFIDITDRKRLEIERMDILANLETAEEQAGLGSWYFDVSINKGWWSKQMYQLFGLEPGREIPGNEEYLAMIHPEDRELLAQTLVQMYQGAAPEKRDFRILPKYGTMRILSPQYHMEKDQAGRVIRFSGTVLDITERKQAEEQIRQWNEELEARVIERTSQLEAANKELESFSYSVSHDLRAPLRAIDGYTNILLEDYESALDEEGKRVCGIISLETKRMGRLIDDLLSFSRMGRREIRFQKIDMKALVDSVLDELLKENDRSRIELRVADLHPATGDSALIRQAWVNLLANAIKFTSRKERAVIEVDSSESDEGVAYAVRDNGAGFEMEYVDKLFGVFQRLHGESEFEGTGVGLAIVQRVVHRHGGRVWAEGKVGEGATFHLLLPKRNETI